jgi:glucan biosynthesis protein C
MDEKLSEMKKKLATLRAKQRISLASNNKNKKKKKEEVSVLILKEPLSTRFHGLDFLRAMAMLMGLVFHAPMLYYIPIMADGFQEFGISTATMPPMENWLNTVVQWLHSWRMTVFFMISGFFTGLILSKRSPKQFITDRFLKLGMTMLLFAAFYDMLDGKFQGDLVHMWFVYYLLMFSCIAWLISITRKPIKQTNQQQNYKIALIKLLLLLTALILIRPIADQIDGGHIGVASHYYTPKPGGLIYFVAWFFAGMWLYSNRFLLTTAHNKVITLIILVSAIGVFYFLLPDLSGVFGFGATKFDTQYEAIKVSLIKGMNSVLWVTFFTLTTHQVMKNSNNILDWLVTLSFPIYIFHMLPCMLFSAILIGMGFSQIQVLLGAVLGAFVVSLILYYVLIKFTPLSWIVLGYKNSWLKPFKKKF